MKRFLQMLLITSLLLSLAGCGPKASSHLNPPLDAESCKGMYYQAIIDNFKDAGFSDIRLSVLEDLTSNDPRIDGAIESITINDSDSFSADDKFSLDAQVAITYHIIPKLCPPISESDIQNLDYDEIGQTFTDAGFTNVSIKDAYDLDPDSIDSDSVNEVLIDGNTAFSKNDEVPFDAPITVICHYPYEKYTLNLSINFIGNLLFSRYDITFTVDGIFQDTLKHGTGAEYKLRLKEGTHTLAFSNSGDSDIKGEVTLSLTGNMAASYQINCYKDRVDVTEWEKVQSFGEFKNSTRTMYTEDSREISWHIYPKDLSREDVILNITDDSIIDINEISFGNDGNATLFKFNVVGISEGQCEISLQSKSGKTKSQSQIFVVENAPVIRSFGTFLSTSYRLETGDTYTFMQHISPCGVSREDFRIELSDNSVISVVENLFESEDDATVFQYTVKALSQGEATITLVSSDEKTTSQTLTFIVSQKDTSRTVYITPNGERYHFSAACAGKNASSTTLNWAKSHGYGPCKKCAS